MFAVVCLMLEFVTFCSYIAVGHRRTLMYGNEILPFTMREQHAVKLFENSVLMRAVGSRRGSNRKLEETA
jgi:hypothetical protein